MKSFDNFLGLRYYTVRAPLLEVRASCFQGAIFFFRQITENPPLDKIPATVMLAGTNCFMKRSMYVN